MPIERVNGVDLHYLQSGEGDDVLLLCGLGDDVTAWDGQAVPLSERYRVTVVDNRGVGRSSLPDGEFTVRDLPPTRSGCATPSGSSGRTSWASRWAAPSPRSSRSRVPTSSAAW